MTIPVLGELLTAAAGQIDLALSCQQRLDDAAKAAAISQLDRLTGTLARYALDVTISGELDIAGSPFTGIRQARASTRTALRRAAQSTRRAAAATGTGPAATAHPAVAHLSRAADCLAAGCDLLQTHFTTDTTGLRTGISRWASLIWSRPAATIMLTEMARYAGQLAPWTAQLSLAGPADSAVPPLACIALHTASRWLWTASTTMTTALRHHALPAADRALVHAIPANFPPPRPAPGTALTISELCAGAAVTAQRLRSLPIAIPGAQPPSSAAGTAASWRRSALAAAIISHTTQLLLRTLAHRAHQLAPHSPLYPALDQATDAAGQTWPHWRAVAQALDLVRTGDNHQAPSPVAADLADLTLWIGRLAYDHPGWTPASSDAAPLRAPQNLAPQPPDIATILAAAHHAADAVLQAVPPDKHALTRAATRQHLYIRTSLLPERYDIPYRYAPIPPAHLDGLLAAYTTATDATRRMVASLDTLATTLGTPTNHLAATRPHQPTAASQAGNRHRASEPPGHWALATPLPQSGQVEQALHALQITEPAMLTQAAAIDSATQHLIDQATAKAHRRSTTTDPQPHPSPHHRLPRHPAEVARTDSPDPRTTRTATTPSTGLNAPAPPDPSAAQPVRGTASGKQSYRP